MIQNDFLISYYLDERRKKANGLFPVKLNVYNSLTKKNKYYPTKFEFSPKDYQSVWKTTKTRSEFTEVRLEMMAVESLANEVSKTIKPFNFELFEKKFYRKTSDGSDVFYHFNEMILKNINQNSLGNASMYQLSRKSIRKFLNLVDTDTRPLYFVEITNKWLSNYQEFMVKSGRSPTTVSMYLRCLKALFNKAIEEKEISSEIYPFGKSKFSLPASRNIKKALSSKELKLLFDAKPLTREQEKARDFWFFSFVCNGMNIKDIALLKWKHFDGEKLVIPRAKTARTSPNALPIVVCLEDFGFSIIKKYGSISRNKEDYIFQILSDEYSELEKFKKVKNFTRFINQNFKKLALSSGLNKEISTYWARHSFATQAIRAGASMEYVSRALTHSNMVTTDAYYDGLGIDYMKDITSKLMQFK